MSNFPRLIPAFTCLVSVLTAAILPQNALFCSNQPCVAHIRQPPNLLILLSPQKSSQLTIPLQIVLDPRQPVGAVSSSGPLTLAPFHPSGSLKSEPGYPISVDATFVHGSDYIRQDASQKHVRLDVNSLLKDKSGAMIKFDYSGVIELSPQTGMALTGAEGAKTTDFGDVRK
jgi:hypothetical protein